MQWADQLGLFWHYLLLSTFAVGGVPAVMRKMEEGGAIGYHPELLIQKIGAARLGCP